MRTPNLTLASAWRGIMRLGVVIGLAAISVVALGEIATASDRDFARSDSDKRYLHHIDLYDDTGRKITPESDRPYSPRNTCGRCHDYETISHGWHFNAFRNHTLRRRTGQAAASPPETSADQRELEPETEGPVTDGRQGEPWIWVDPRTGTQLPLSDRQWPGVFHPADVGIDEFAMTRQFGGRIPGGQVELPKTWDESTELNERWKLTGELEVDCMTCHAVTGAYDFELRRETIEDENFAWAPTAGLRLGQVAGSVARIKDGSDPEDEKVQAKLPKVQYDDRRFGPDGTVFIDLVRQVDNNACYQCHSQRTVAIDDSGATVGIEQRWIHDQDVHLQAGMNCTDCHRNGIDHHITRGYEGELHPSGQAVTTLSCVGCHLGTDFYLDEEEAEASVALRDIANRSGRLGSPLPMHHGLPPIHFEKMTCTACHSGPIPGDHAAGLMTSLSHALGSKEHRTGDELPLIRGPIFAPSGEMAASQETVSADKGGESEVPTKVTAARAVWPAFWGFVQDGKVTPLPPDEVYSVTRKSLRVRRDFVEEITQPTLQDEEEAGLFDEKVYAALTAIEDQMKVETAVYVSSGKVLGRDSEEGKLKSVSIQNESMVGMVRWPMAHAVRPAGWSLGATGCIECHADDGKIFASTVAAVGPAPFQTEAVTMASLQGISEADRTLWNQMFVGRSLFKILIAASLGLLMVLMLVGLAAKTYSAAMTILGGRS